MVGIGVYVAVGVGVSVGVGVAVAVGVLVNVGVKDGLYKISAGIGADELLASATHPGIAAHTTTAEVNRINIINAVAAHDIFLCGFAAFTFFAAALTGIGTVGPSALKLSTMLVSALTGSAGSLIFKGPTATAIGIAGESGFLASEILTG